MKIGAIIQARSSSSRLPKKVLKKLPYNGDISVLAQVIRRVKKSNLIDKVIVATSRSNEECGIVDITLKENALIYRGSLENVLERYYDAALEFDLDIIVRITSDCPCIDFNIIDDVIKDHIDNDYDYTSNSLIETFPRGIDVEVINFEVLKKAYLNATEKYEKEHVTPYIYKSHPEDFKINKYHLKGINNSDIRITLDTYQDYTLLCLIYDELYENNNYFTLKEILKLFEEKPYLKDINKDIIQKKVCNSLEEELDEAIRLCDLQDLDKAKEYIEKIL